MSDESLVAAYLPVEERVAEALRADRFDESDTINVLVALRPILDAHARLEREHDRAQGAIWSAIELARRFDPTCGSARTRTFLADLERVLRGKS